MSADTCAMDKQLILGLLAVAFLLVGPVFIFRKEVIIFFKGLWWFFKSLIEILDAHAYVILWFSAGILAWNGDTRKALALALFGAAAFGLSLFKLIALKRTHEINSSTSRYPALLDELEEE